MTEPRRIAQFEILDSLGEGGMGVVYRARDTILRREVALKLIRPTMSADPRSRERFLRECRAAAALNHPGIATLYEVGEADDGQLFFAGEMIAGRTLQEHCAHEPLAPDEAIDLGRQLAEALGAAHGHGIVHRDIKPGNVMVTDDGRIKILDFGLARLLDPIPHDADSRDETLGMTQTRPGTLLGTPAYMAPEQAQGRTADARSDVFAAGCVLYEMVCGVAPFAGDSVAGTLRRILADDPVPPRALDRQIPPALGRVILRALSKEPEDRYASGSELAEALRRVSDKPAYRLRRGAVAGASIAVVLLIAMGVLWWSTKNGLAFSSRDLLLIAAVDNRTEEPVFDLALRTALEADLQQSPYASVLDRNRADETLALMRRDPTATVDEELGRDLCRFAGVRALLLPRILAVGDAYELQAILVDPITGRHVEQIRVRAQGREEVLLSAIDELSREVRRRLGESLSSIEEADQPIDQVMTSSWEALHDFSVAHTLWAANKPDEAAALFGRALEKDPRFTSAKASLGLMLIQTQRDDARGRALLREALAEMSGLPDYDQRMIRAVHRQFVEQDPIGVLAEYKVIHELYPNRVEPVNNQAHILSRLGRLEEAEALYVDAAGMNERNAWPLTGLFWTRMRMRRPRAAEETARKLVALAPEMGQFRHYLAWSLWSQNRIDEALSELRSLDELEPDHPYARFNFPRLLLLTGAAEEAAVRYRALLRRVEAGELEGSREGLLVQLAQALSRSGRLDEARALLHKELEALRSGPEPQFAWEWLGLASLAAATGDVESGQRYFDRAQDPDEADAVGWMLRAQSLSLLGRYDEALDALRLAFDAEYRDYYFPLIMPEFIGLRDDPRFLALFDSDSTPLRTPARARP